LKSSRVIVSVDSMTPRSARHFSTGDNSLSVARAGSQLIKALSAHAKTRFIVDNIITNSPLHSPRRLR
jgi:hypothetical protein